MRVAAYTTWCFEVPKRIKFPGPSPDCGVGQLSGQDAIEVLLMAVLPNSFRSQWSMILQSLFARRW
jgi:hypothetical protein